jgi:hypothetical protein
MPATETETNRTPPVRPATQAILALALTLPLAACLQYQADPSTVTAAPHTGNGIILFKTGPIHLTDMPATTVFGQPHYVGSLIIEPYDPRAVEHGKIVTGQIVTVFPGKIPFANGTPGGWQAYPLPPGDYFIKALYRLRRSACYNEGSIAFHIDAGQSLFLGDFNAGAALAHIADEAAADATQRTHTGSDFLGVDRYRGNETLNRSAEGWLPPTAAGAAEAQTFMQTTYASTAPVTPATFTPVAWQTAPGRESGDGCGTWPATVRSAFLKLQSASPEGLIVSFGDPPRDPSPMLPGITLTPTHTGPQQYLWKFDDTLSLADAACRPTNSADLFRLAQRPGDIGVQFITYANKDGTPWAPPKIHVFVRHSDDTVDCSSLGQADQSVGGGIIVIPQVHIHR